jgi:SAM-dependent methyltransferase
MIMGEAGVDDPTSTTRDTYDRIADSYRERAAGGWPEQADDIVAFRASLPDPGGWVADVGCGPGRDTAALRAAGLRTVGVDLSIGQLRAGGLDGVAQADMRALPLATGALAGVWCMASLLHLPRPDVPVALAELARACRAGAALHLAVADGDGEGFEEARMYGSTLRRWFTYHREPALRDLLAAAGFAVTGVRRRSGHREWIQVLAVRRSPDRADRPIRA